MEGFGNILKAELFKLAKGKQLVKLIVALIIIFVVFTILFNFLYELAGEVLNNTTATDGEVTEEAVEIAKANYDEAVKQNESLNAYRKMTNTNVYQAKAVYNLYKYMYEHNVSISSVSMLGAITDLSANSYISFMMDIMATIFAIFGIVIMIKSFAGERSNGTLKMQLLRPISKDAIIIGKLLATWIVSIGALIFMFVVTCVVGVIAFKVNASQVIGILNGENVFMISPAGAMIITLIYHITYVSQFIMLGLFAASLMKKNSGGSIAIGLVALLVGGNIEQLLGYIFVGYIGISLNISWMNALTLTGPSLNYMNLYSMLGISILWFAGMLAASILMFRKEDVHS